MSFQKDKETKYGVTANYHTITDVKMPFIQKPKPILDADGNVTGFKGGSISSLTLSSYKDKIAYDADFPPLEQKSYSIDFMTALGVARSSDKTCEQAAYDLIKQLDPFWEDAIEIE